MKKKLKSTLKLVIILTLVITILLVFNSFAFSKKSKNVTLRLAWWGNPTRDARTIEVVKMYMAENPNVIIETETTGWAGYWDKLNTQAAAKNLPDIMQQDYAYLMLYAKRNLLLDLTSYVKSKKLDLTGVSDDFTSGGKINNKFYGVSLGTNAVAFLLDPAVFQKAGLQIPDSTKWTWADFEEIALTIYKKTGVKVPVYSGVDPKVLFDNMIRQTNQSFFNTKDGSSLGFNDTKLLVEFYDSQLRLLKSGAMTKPDISFMNVTPQESSLAKGEEWGNLFWSNQVVMMQAAMKRPVEVVLLPRISNSKRPGTYLKPSMFFSVTKDSKNKEEAVKFINYFITNIEANKVLQTERGIPIVPKVRDALKGILDPVSKQVFEYIDLVGNGNSSPIDPPDPVGAGEVLKVFRTVDQEVLYGSLSPEKGAEKFMKEANKILEKNK